MSPFAAAAFLPVAVFFPTQTGNTLALRGWEDLVQYDVRDYNVELRCNIIGLAFCSAIDACGLPFLIFNVLMPTRTSHTLKGLYAHINRDTVDQHGDQYGRFNANWNIRGHIVLIFFLGVSDLLMLPFGLLALFNPMRCGAVLRMTWRRIWGEWDIEACNTACFERDEGYLCKVWLVEGVYALLDIISVICGTVVGVTLVRTYALYQVTICIGSGLCRGLYPRYIFAPLVNDSILNLKGSPRSKGNIRYP